MIDYDPLIKRIKDAAVKSHKDSTIEKFTGSEIEKFNKIIKDSVEEIDPSCCCGKPISHHTKDVYIQHWELHIKHKMFGNGNT